MLLKKNSPFKGRNFGRANKQNGGPAKGWKVIKSRKVQRMIEEDGWIPTYPVYLGSDVLIQAPAEVVDYYESSLSPDAPKKKVEKTYTLDEVREAVKASGFGAAVVFKVLQNLR